MIDLKSRDNQVPLDEKDIEKTAVITPFGLLEWTKMPFGLMNSGSTFQWVMHEILGDLPVFVYIDDILISYRSPQEHEVHLR